MIRRFLGLLGSLLLAAGVFVPIWQIPFDESINLTFQHVFGGYTLLVLSTGALALTIAGKYSWLWIPAVLSIWVGSIEYARMDARILEADLQWGWLVLLASSLLLIATALLNRGEAARNKSNQTRETVLL